ncbi:3-isopropylmalate/(R)-2-methylmalate dehydratase large subunit [Novosphingobium kunmingense]|uniref:3-isopropylmalate dehydratase large subunit n=2 Tax=Novosphingobium kunmingense TaxID=1211806 RepID=A0A2N0H6M0_9SPHN|nr:3-isopropylmalate/(R)-2-methylmalate dehydratase large subunit [Novosphingobium kunmingense]
MRGRTLYEKLWDSHVVRDYGDGSALLYVDRHLLHEVSTPQSFVTLRSKQAAVRRPSSHIAVPDHAVPTTDRTRPIGDPMAAAQVAALETNAKDFGIPFIALTDQRQGIVHVVGPELGFTLPGITLGCGDSHTSTHGAFGALAFGIGASDCATILATQCIVQQKARSLEVRLEGTAGLWIGAKDYALAMIGRYGVGFGTGHAIEYRGPVVEAMSMAARMTLCNMSIEAGARIGMVAPDATTYAYLEGRPYAPLSTQWDRALAYWKSLVTDADAKFDKSIVLDVSDLAPQVTWGTSPHDALGIDARVPDPRDAADDGERQRIASCLDYMGLRAGTALQDVRIDKVFIGSCTNGRIEDLREAARVVAGRKVASGVDAIVVPGSTAVRRQAEEEGLDRVFTDAGLAWREAGCSMCVAMNADRLAPRERCASTSNRNFEGRQGREGRTHLMSPASAAASAIVGYLADVREIAT